MKYLWKGVGAGRLCFHIHHLDLLEISIEPLEARAKHIRTQKPKPERATRLRLMRPVRGKLPAQVVKAAEDLRRKYTARKKAYDGLSALKTIAAKQCRRRKARAAEKAQNQAWNAFSKAVERHQPAIEKLHVQECPNCPWDGKTIFPRKRK